MFDERLDPIAKVRSAHKRRAAKEQFINSEPTHFLSFREPLIQLQQ